VRSTLANKRAARAAALALGVFSATAFPQDAQDQRGLVTDSNDSPTKSAKYLPAGQAPVIAPAPLAVYERVAFDANILFDSDKSALRPAGRDKLDAFVRKIHGLESRPLMAISYADRMGGEEVDQILSEERVNTVKAYLVSKGIASERVRTSAWGETRQPDRHVFIEVSGNRLAQ